MRDLKPLTDAEITELLGWVSACQSSYHIDSTPSHRFGGLGSHLQENRDSLVKYVNALIAARAQPAQAVPVLTEREIEDMYEAVKGKGWSLDFARAIERAVRAKMGVAGWQPISTAPKGQRVLVWIADRKAGENIAFAKVWLYDDGTLGGGAEGFNGKWDLTHWMPLPPPPGIVGKEGA